MKKIIGLIIFWNLSAYAQFVPLEFVRLCYGSQGSGNYGVFFKSP